MKKHIDRVIYDTSIGELYVDLKNEFHETAYNVSNLTKIDYAVYVSTKTLLKLTSLFADEFKAIVADVEELEKENN